MQNVSITKLQIWMGSMFQNMDPWEQNIFPTIAKMKGEVYATKIHPYLFMTRLALDRLWAYFCVTIMPVFYHKSRLYS